MALVSPGIQISINDQSQYVSNAVGSVPLLILATAENKTYSGKVCAGTSKANAGKLQSFTSQRDLVTAMGTPTFRRSSAGTPVHAGELNEYGLMTAYSALGLGNQLFAIRADIDLDQLVGTSVRPINNPVNETYWLDIGASEFGIHSLNRVDTDFDKITPLVITNESQVENDSAFAFAVPKPKASVGAIGTYAIVAVGIDGNNPSVLRLWKKTGTDSLSTAANGPGSNAWVLVGSSEWQLSVPVVTGSFANPTITIGTTLIINNITITATGATVGSLATDINTANITGVRAAAVGTKLVLFCTSSAVQASMVIANGTMNVSAVLGITVGAYAAPILFYGNYAERPAGGWFSQDQTPRPAGSVWWKLGQTGQGLNLVLKQYNSNSGTFQSISVPAYLNTPAAIAALDPIGGGINLQAGQAYVAYRPSDTTANSLTLFTHQGTDAGENSGETTAFSGTPVAFTAGSTFTIDATQPGTTNDFQATITLTGTSTESFVQDILAANIPFVTAAVTSSGTISITHQRQGQMVISNTSTAPVNPLADAGFETDAAGAPTKGSGYRQNKVTGDFVIDQFRSLTARNILEITASAPYASPATGTFWYYSNPADVDIMINTSSGFKGYRTVATDTRGYALTTTDPAGVIVSATEPQTQSDASALVAGDLWLDSSDLLNYPSLYRYTGLTWSAIDNTDQTTNNGIVFADARWDTTGTQDPVVDTLPAISSLLNDDYLDLDAPDYRLYPQGMLLFNTRRSGYNVKRYVANYYNEVSFPNVGVNQANLPTSLPSGGARGAWISSSGLNDDGTMKAGSAAQRAVVVAAMQGALDSNLEIREDLYQFNLLVAPGYPELIDNLVTLNTDRGETGFVIGDTPMTLMPNTTELSNWNNNTNGNGLATASPYLAVYYPSGLTTDLSGNTIAVPPSYAVLRTFLYSDNVAYPWFAPAGTQRGLVSNIQDVGYVDYETGSWNHNSIGQGLRDSLYTLNINPVTQLPGVGIVVWGQETRSGTSTARNRINVTRLENYLRVIFKSIANGFLFEPNDQVTRKSIATQIETACNDILSKRGIYDFLVVCDSSNNTSSTIANNQMFVDVAIEPARDVEFIFIPIALYNPGALAALGTSST